MSHFFNAGGPLPMSVITLFGWAIIILSVISIRAILSGKQGSRVYLNNIPIVGTAAFMTGILAQTVGMYEALGAILAAVDVSPSIIMGGFRVSLIAPMYGLILFVLSLLIYLALSSWREATVPTIDK